MGGRILKVKMLLRVNQSMHILSTYGRYWLSIHMFRMVFLSRGRWIFIVGVINQLTSKELLENQLRISENRIVYRDYDRC